MHPAVWLRFALWEVEKRALVAAEPAALGGLLHWLAVWLVGCCPSTGQQWDADALQGGTIRAGVPNPVACYQDPTLHKRPHCSAHLPRRTPRVADAKVRYRFLYSADPPQHCWRRAAAQNTLLWAMQAACSAATCQCWRMQAARHAVKPRRSVSRNSSALCLKTATHPKRVSGPGCQ